MQVLLGSNRVGGGNADLWSGLFLGLEMQTKFLEGLNRIPLNSGWNRKTSGDIFVWYAKFHIVTTTWEKVPQSGFKH